MNKLSQSHVNAKIFYYCIITGASRITNCSFQTGDLFSHLERQRVLKVQIFRRKLATFQYGRDLDREF